MLLILVLLFLACSPVAQASMSACDMTDGQPLLFGTARDQNTDELIYCEYYFATTAAQQFVVEYRLSDARLIARKQLDFLIDPLAPRVIQEDFRRGELRAVERLTATQLSVSYRPTVNDATRQQTLNLDGIVVVDAGFDQAVKQYWQRLLEGEKMLSNLSHPFI